MAMIILHIREYFRKRKGTFLTLYAILQDSDKIQLRDAEFIGYTTTGLNLCFLIRVE